MTRFPKIIVIFIFLSAIFVSYPKAQIIVPDSLIITSLDTTLTKKNDFNQTDSLFFDSEKVIFEKKDSIGKYPDPNRVVWMGAIVPGLGQIINKKYWKLPIVYGGFLVCSYAITWNGGQYSTYKNAYRDIMDTNPNTTSYLDILPKNVTIAQIGGEQRFKSILKSKQESYRRYRDLSILVSVLYYGLTVLDAYVDAQLFDFDISPDLSMSLRPKIETGANNGITIREKNAYGIQLSLNF